MTKATKRLLLVVSVLGLLLVAATRLYANSGHDGTEQGLSRIVALQALGQPGSPAGLNLQGGTPNHKALAAAAAYGWSLRQPRGSKEALAGRARVLEFLQGQLRTFMAVGGVSEFETSSHYSWWQAAFAGIWLQAYRAQDAEVLALIRRIEVQARTVELACSTPSGHVVIPGGRAFLGAGESDQRAQRDQGRAIVDGRKARLPTQVLDPHVAPAATDRIGLWLLQQIPESELQVVRNAAPELPSLLDPMQIQRSSTGHVAWFDEFHGLRPAYFAWVDYRTGQEKYGVDPSWPKGQPGGPRPAGMVVPTAGSPIKVWKLGLGGEQR